MKLVKVKKSFFDMCEKHGVADELLYDKTGRPCVLLIDLMFHDKCQEFVVPMRSNISKKVPVCDYFVLPPNSDTKKTFRHGVHYTKLFPITLSFIDTYMVDDDKYYDLLLCLLEEYESEITNACQNYLDEYQEGHKRYVTPDLDGILEVLHK